jgi:hypothetical protein
MKTYLTFAWWKLKVTQFQNIVFVATIFGHHNVVLPNFEKIPIFLKGPNLNKV